MYLIGVFLWTLIAGVLAWVFAYLLTRRAKASWSRWLTGLILLPLILVAPLGDEIIGKSEFDHLCEESKEVAIYGTISVGEELYTPDGKWRLELPNASRELARNVDGLFRWDHGGSPPTTVPSASIPIYRFDNKVFEQRSGRLLAAWTEYGTPGGWLSQQLETPLLVRSSCAPGRVEMGIYKQLATYAKGDNK